MFSSRSLIRLFAGRSRLAGLAAFVVVLAVAVPVYAAFSTGDTGSGTLTILKPDGLAENEVMLANIAFRGDTTATITPPAGWTLIAKRTNTTTVTAAERITQATYRKVATGSEPTSYVWTFGGTGGSGNGVGGIASFSGIDTANPINASATNPATDSGLPASASTVAPSVDPTETNTRIVSMWAYDTDDGFTKPAAMTEIYSKAKQSGNGTTSRARSAAADMSHASDAATDPQTATAGASIRYVAQTVALNRKESQTITFDQPTTPQTFGDEFHVDPFASSGLDVALNASGGCTVAPGDTDGFDVTMTSGTTACVLTASQAGNASWLAAPNVARTVLAQKKSQALTFDQPDSPKTFGDTFNVNPTSDSGLTVTVNATGGCSAVAGTPGYDVEITSGTTDCVLTASQAGNANYSAATNVPRTVDVEKADQAITFDAPATPRGFGETFTVDPESDSGLEVALAATGGCSAEPGATDGFDVTMTSPTETCVLTASQAGDDNYNAATDVVHNVAAQKGSQTITFAQPTTPRGFGETFNVDPESDSGLEVALAATGGCSAEPGATDGFDVTMTSPTETCVLTASQAGDDNYNAATDVVHNVAAQKGSQTITFAQPASPRTFGDTFNVDPTSSSGLDVTVGASGGCTVEPGATDGWDVEMTSGTTACVLTASQGGDANYSPASNVQKTVMALKANQTIDFPQPDPQTFGTTFNVNPTAPAGAVTVTSPNNDGCSVAAGATDGWDVTMTDGTKDCELTAKRDGTNDYNAAPDVVRNVTAQKASQTITFEQPASPQVYGDTFTVVATSTSGLDVMITPQPDPSGVCSASGLDVTMLSGAGDCVLKASQNGNTDYSAATDVQRTVAAAKKSVTVDMSAAPGAQDKVYDGNSTAVVDFTNAQLVDVLSADTDVTLDASGYSASFSSKNVGTDKVVAVTGLAATDAGSGKAANYTVDQPEYSATGPVNENLLADITVLSTTGSINAANKVYDGSASATATKVVDGRVGSDAVTLGGTASFASASVGNGKVVALASPTLGGADAGNYDLTTVSTDTANITKRSVTGQFTAADKDFDGTKDATITGRSLTGAIAGDEVSLSGGVAGFVSEGPGVDITVLGFSFTLSGSDAGNYSLGSVGSTTATIRQRGPGGQENPPTEEEIEEGASDKLGGDVKPLGTAFGDLAFGFAPGDQGKKLASTNQPLFAIGCLAACDVAAKKTVVLTTGDGAASAAATKKLKLKAQNLTLAEGEVGVIKLKLTKKQKRKIKKATKAKLIAKTTVESAGETVTGKKTYRLKT